MDIISPGARVLVPLGKLKAIGFFIEKSDTAPPSGLKSVIETIDKQPLFSKEILSFLLWMADYYMAGIGDVLQAALPPNMRKIRQTSESTSMPPEVLKGYKINLTEIEDDGIREAYSQTGAMHVLAVSGLHVGMVALLLGLLLKHIHVRRREFKWFKPAMQVAGIWGFALLTGASPSVLRAATNSS